MKLTATNIKYFSIILIGVSLAYLVNQVEGAISPLFMSMVLGLILVNAGGWNKKGKAAATFAKPNGVVSLVGAPANKHER